MSSGWAEGIIHCINIIVKLTNNFPLASIAPHPPDHPFSSPPPPPTHPQIKIKLKLDLSCWEWFSNASCSAWNWKKNPGCPYFKSWATKAMNLVALMNPWLPSRKTYTFKCTTQKNIHFCLLSAFNYMLTLHQNNNCRSSCHLVWTATKVTCLSMFSAVLVFFFLCRSVHPYCSI